MRNWTIMALRVVIALAFAGSLFVQIWMMPIIWADLEGAEQWMRVSFIVLLVLGIVTLQVCAVCIWQLLTMVRRGSVFSAAAFGYVDVIIGAVATASVLLFLLAVLLAPGDAAPGIVGLICGASLVTAGIALLVLVMRMLLAQAVAREGEARQLRTELDGVI
jgi:hypothetical protein